MKLWTCKGGHPGVLAPARPRSDDARRLCLDCTKATGRITWRVCVVRESQKRRKEQAQEARRQARAGQPDLPAVDTAATAPAPQLNTPSPAPGDVLGSDYGPVVYGRDGRAHAAEEPPEPGLTTIPPDGHPAVQATETAPAAPPAEDKPWLRPGYLKAESRRAAERMLIADSPERPYQRGKAKHTEPDEEDGDESP